MGSSQAIEGRRNNPVVGEHGEFRHLEVVVLFTTTPGTLEALRSAAELAQGLRARIRLLVPHVVAYPLPLDRPAVQMPVLVRRFIAISEHAEADTTVDIRLCRDPWDAIREALNVRSIVVVGGRRRWWTTREDSIARRLRAEGHHVVLAETK